MKFIDTHAHLYSEQYEADTEDIINRAIEAGVTKMILPDVDSTSREQMLALAEKYPENLYTMIGVHPTSINDNPAWRSEITMVREQLEKGAPQLCAVGEIGLDLHWSRDFIAEQEEAFAQQIELALEHNLPINIHVRKAWAELMPILRRYKGSLRGSIHAFSGGESEYKAVKALGDFKFGIGGVVTFKGASLADAVTQMHLDDLVLETDAPFLAPTPHRGTRNESAYIPLIAQFIANLKGESLQTIAEVTTHNATTIFNL